MRKGVFKNLVNKPGKVKDAVLSRLIRVFSQVYDRVMLFVDRAISILFVPIYDIGDLIRKKNIHAVKALVCINSYMGKIKSGESHERHFIEKTVVKYMGDDDKVSIHYWDDHQQLVGMGFNFYKKVASLNPEYLILSSYDFNRFYHPMLWVLARLRKRNIRIIALWWDTCSSNFAKSISPAIGIIDFHAILDNPTLSLGETRDDQLLKEKSKFFHPPCDIEVEKKERNIDIGFFGSVSSYRDVRRHYINFLLESGVALYSYTGGKDEPCTYEKYYSILSRCKIGLNLSWSVDRHQLKGRVLETMYAGCLLMEERNEQTASVFIEGEDYVAFSSEEELLEKVKYYLEHEDERQKISESGKRKAKQKFNGKQFWDEILSS